jgi:hypothetical protein
MRCQVFNGGNCLVIIPEEIFNKNINTCHDIIMFLGWICLGLEVVLVCFKLGRKASSSAGSSYSACHHILTSAPETGVLKLIFFWYFFRKETHQKNVFDVETSFFTIWGRRFPRCPLFWRVINF